MRSIHAAGLWSTGSHGGVAPSGARILVVEDDGVLAYLNRLRAAAARMSQLIDALLSLAQVGRGDLQPIDLDFSYLVRSVASEIAAANPGRNVPVAIAPGMRAYGDPRLLRIVVANLLENAWKFTGRRQRPAIEVGPCQNTRQPTYCMRTASSRALESACRLSTESSRVTAGRSGRTRSRSRARRFISACLRSRAEARPTSPPRRSGFSPTR